MNPFGHLAFTAAGAAFLAAVGGQHLGDPWLYGAAIAGGSGVDLLDHAGYQLLYGRNQPEVRRIRQQLFEAGPRAALIAAREAEKKRLFQGLWLHNAITLCIASLVSLVLALSLRAPWQIFVALAALLLHLVTDIAGDVWAIGNFDNWWWPLPTHLLKQAGRTPSRRLFLALLPPVAASVAFGVVGARIAFQFASMSDRPLGGHEVALAVPIILLVSYACLFPLGSALCARKYRHFCGWHPGSRGTWGRAFRGHYAFREFQRRHGWSVAATALVVATVLLAITAGTGRQPAVVFLAAVVASLTVSTFVHSTAGEVGTILGVSGAWAIDVVLGRLDVIRLWPANWGYLVVAIAAFSWLIGIVGSLLLRGRIVMSRSFFVISVKVLDPANGIASLRRIATHALGDGYRQAHSIVAGVPLRSFAVRSSLPRVLAIPANGTPIIDSRGHRLYAKAVLRPALRELRFLLLFGSRLGKDLEPTPLAPPMPRSRIWPATLSNGQEVHSDGRDMTWACSGGGITFANAGFFETVGPATFVKCPDEVADNLNTRYSNVCANLEIRRGDQPQEFMIVCQVREQTSTKEYATIEAQSYGGCVLESLQTLLDDEKGVEVARVQTGRVVYPEVAVYEARAAGLLAASSLEVDPHAHRAPDELMAEWEMSPGVAQLLPWRRLLAFAGQLAVALAITIAGIVAHGIDTLVP